MLDIKFASQYRLLAEFLSNSAVAWLVIAITSPTGLLNSVRALAMMLMTLFTALKMLEISENI